MNFTYYNKGDHTFLTVPEFTELGVVNLFTTSSLDFNLKAEAPFTHRLKQYQICLDALNWKIPFPTISTVHQIHSNHVILTDRYPRFSTISHWRKYGLGDGLITSEKNHFLCIQYADCIPVILYDPKQHILANIHSGWRGTFEEITLCALLKMKHHYGSRPEDIRVLLGPALGPDDFQVQEDVYSLFAKKFSSDFDLIQRQDARHWLIDTKELLMRGLKRRGVLQEHINNLALSTLQQELFHSHRRQGKDHGLMCAFVAMA